MATPTLRRESRICTGKVTILQQQLTNSGDEEGTDRKCKTGDAPGPAGPAALAAPPDGPFA
jgi:hypothetical protein